AAQTDDRIDLFAGSKLGTCIDHVRVRIDLEIVKTNDVDSRGAQWFQSFVDMTRRDHAVVGHKPHAPEPQFPGDVAQAADGSGAKDHSSTRLKVERLQI